ncbi:MAG: DivIVA domain-containing protein, partial [Oscillospiraceae bacterium]
MLTPQNFREKTFDKAIFGGYDMAAVDDFLDEAANDYSAIAKENMVLKSKMKVLVDKIEEYRTTEDTMRQTLLSAQKLAAQIEADARAKANEIIESAKAESERITRESYAQRSTEEARLLEAKRESTKYIENMRALCSRQLDFLDSLQSLKLEDMQTAQPEKAKQFDETVRSIESSVEKLAPGEGEKPVRETVSEAPSGGADEPTRLFSAPAGGQTGPQAQGG